MKYFLQPCVWYMKGLLLAYCCEVLYPTMCMVYQELIGVKLLIQPCVCPTICMVYEELFVVKYYIQPYACLFGSTISNNMYGTRAVLYATMCMG